MFAYVDETGNTGARLLDWDQPLFITAAFMTRSDFERRFGEEVREIAKSLGFDELHAAQLGVGRLENVAPDLLKVIRKAGPAFSLARVEKAYVLATKVFDTLFDSFENKAVPWHVYNVPPLRMTMLFKVAYLLDEQIAEAFLDALLDPVDQRALEKMAGVCRQIAANVDLLPDQRSKEIIGDAMTWAAQHPECLHFVHSDKVGRKSHLPNMVGFGNLLGGIEKQSVVWQRPVDRIIHDRQHEFAQAIEFWHKMYSNALPDAVNVPFSGKMVLRKVFGSKLEISSAKESAGIQIIDVVLWLFSRSLKQDLPPNCQKLLDYVHGRAHSDDFSFAAAEVFATLSVDRANAVEMTPKAIEDARALSAEIEQRRLQAMSDFEREKKAR